MNWRLPKRAQRNFDNLGKDDAGLYEIQSAAMPEKAVLAAVDTGEYDAEASLSELRELAKTAGAEVCSTMVQKRLKPDVSTYLGQGRLEELRNFVEAEEVDLLICDGELSPTQIRNMEKMVSCRVIDRTMLILDIFAGRAHSREGKLQVELAQLQYLLPRLAGQGLVLSRLGGGIGTRGPGESQLETDRRHIRRRIDSLKRQLEQVRQHRERLRERRRKDGVQTVALVGYTNAGKSTLMNALTNAGVLAEDKLFATLDPTSRALQLPGGSTVMLIDTVGLVRRLPHHLVEAFHSTLEEAARADVILNLCDASSPEAELHLEVAAEMLADLGCADRPMLSVWNKCDLLPEDNRYRFGPKSVCISARTGEGISFLLERIEAVLPGRSLRMELLFPLGRGDLAARLRREGTLLSEEYVEQGIRVSALVPENRIAEMEEYRIQSN